VALLRTLWRLSYEDVHDWLRDWPALALACGLPVGKDGCPRVPSPSQQCKRGQRAGAPLPEALFVLSVLIALHRQLFGARDLIIDSAPILAWRRADPDAAIGHAPAHHPRPLLRGYRVHTLLCPGSGLPVFFLLSPAHVHDAPFARPLLQWAVDLYYIRPRVIRLDAGYSCLQLIRWIHGVLGAVAVVPWNPKRAMRTASASLRPGALTSEASVLPSNASRGRVFLFFHRERSSSLRVVCHRSAGRFDLHRLHRRRAFLRNLLDVLISSAHPNVFSPIPGRNANHETPHMALDGDHFT